MVTFCFHEMTTGLNDVFESSPSILLLNTNYVNVWWKLSERELLKIASDVSNGMRHLESKLVSNNLLCVLFSTDLEIQLQLREYFIQT